MSEGGREALRPGALTAFLRDRCPGATLDAATEEFVRGPKVPQRFANMTQFIEYDSTYD